jgi:hypothetical protein
MYGLSLITERTGQPAQWLRDKPAPARFAVGQKKNAALKIDVVPLRMKASLVEIRPSDRRRAKRDDNAHDESGQHLQAYDGGHGGGACERDPVPPKHEFS